MSGIDKDDTLGRLFVAATDDNVSTLQDIAMDAGLLWSCPHCKTSNREDEDTCCDCGAGRDGGTTTFSFQYRREQRVDFDVVAKDAAAAQKMAETYVANLAEGWDESDDPGEFELLDSTPASGAPPDDGECPFCHNRNTFKGDGFSECYDCGKTYNEKQPTAEERVALDAKDRARLQEVEAALKENGGRGVELAEEADRLREGLAGRNDTQANLASLYRMM